MQRASCTGQRRLHLPGYSWIPMIRAFRGGKVVAAASDGAASSGEGEKGNKDRVLPIISISYCWTTGAHPDPMGKQLAVVAATLEQEHPKYMRFL